ncbi:MAG TPA: MBL fold metallo-hydrolase [Ruminococcaceae bacterium]|nr:MBL fold metallo-hydrolase [Oscillospiraceae bacterium]
MKFICLPVGELDTNCYIVFDNNNQGVVIDPGGESESIIQVIRKYNLNILYVILTHVHFDHMLASNDVLDQTGADFMVPKDDEAALSDTNRNLMHFVGKRRELTLRANRVLADGDRFMTGNLEFQVLHTPGHTPGSSCFICGDLLITGDTLFAGGIGRTDFPGGSSTAIKSSLIRLSKLEGDYTVLPGHGPATTLKSEQQGNPYLNSSDYVIDY